jgi:uncharacterized Tic20 family protein
MSKDNMVILPHILGLLTVFIGPLIILLVSEDSNMKTHSKKALNWQISFMAYLIVLILFFLTKINFLIIISILFVIVLGVMNLVFCILAAVKAADGELWDYPVTINFLK